MSSLGEMLKKNNGNFMVSIHRVPVNVLLIISVVCLIFRFKRGAEAYFNQTGRRKTLKYKIGNNPRHNP